MTIPERILEQLKDIKALLENFIMQEQTVYNFEEGIKAYDVKQVAELFDIAPNTVRRYAQEGKLPYFKLGDKYMFPVERLYEWMNKEVEINEDYIDKMVSGF